MKTKNLFKMLAVCLFMAAATTACNKPEPKDPIIDDDPIDQPVKPEAPKLVEATVTLAAQEGSTVTYEVATDSSWTISADKSYSWVSVDTEAYTGKKTITFRADQLNKTGETRTAVFTVKATKYELYKITVNQETIDPKPVLIEVSLSADPAGEQTVEYEFVTDSTWTVAGDELYDWVSVTPERAAGSETLSFTASENRTGETRTAVFTIKASVYDLVKITLTQESIHLVPLAEGDAEFINACVAGGLFLDAKDGADITPAAGSYDVTDFDPAAFTADSDVLASSLIFEEINGAWYITRIMKELYFKSYPAKMHLSQLTNFEQNGGGHSAGLELPQDWDTPNLKIVELYWASLTGNIPEGLLTSQTLERCMMNYNNFTSCNDRVDLPNLRYLQWGSWFQITKAPSYWNTPRVGEGLESNADGASFSNLSFGSFETMPETFICGSHGTLLLPKTIKRLPSKLDLARCTAIGGEGWWGALPECKDTPLPAEWNTPEVTFICLQNSGFKGLIPQGLADSPKLIELYMEGNKLVGAIPHDWASEDLEVIKLAAAADVNGETCQNNFGYVIPAQFDCGANNYEGGEKANKNMFNDWRQFKVLGEFEGFEKGWGQERYVVYAGASELDLKTWDETRFFETGLREGEKYWFECNAPHQFAEWTAEGAAAYNASIGY